MDKDIILKKKLKGFSINIDDIEPNDNILGALEQQVKKQKEVIDKAVKYINQHWVIDDPVLFKNDLLEILEDKEVSE